MQIIPAIDIINGRCVRLTQGDYDQKTEYKDSPLEAAKKFEAAGVKRLHLVDLDGAKASECKNLDKLEEICSQTSLEVDFSGGISTVDLAQSVLNAGAKYFAVGSVAIKDPQLLIDWIDRFGPEKILLAADCENEFIASLGWLKKSTKKIMPFLEYWTEKGIFQGFVTDISKDGMLEGPSTELYGKIRKEVPNFKLIASGGISKMQDITDLSPLDLDGVIVGKAIYEGRISLQQIENYQSNYAN